MGEVTDIGVLKEAQSTGKVPVGNRIFGVAMLVVGVVLLAISIYEYIQVVKREHNMKQLPIPKSIIDFDRENEAGKYVTYRAVKWNLQREEPEKEGCGREDRGDLNGDGGKQWLALYTTKDATMGEPILADSIVAKTGKQGGRTAPSMKHEPLTLFGRESIQNLVDTEFCYEDAVDGIWMYYVKGTSDQVLEEDTHVNVTEDKTEEEKDKDKEEGEAASGSATGVTGSHISGGRAVFLGTGCAAGGFILGWLCMFLIKRRKVQIHEKDMEV